MISQIISIYRELRAQSMAVRNVKAGRPPWPLLANDPRALLIAEEIMSLPMRYEGEEREDARKKCATFVQEVYTVMADQFRDAAEFSAKHGEILA